MWRRTDRLTARRHHGGTGTPEYAAWSNMRTRCRNPLWPQYADYGGRGIRICDRWNTFAAFLADMGPRPTPEHSLDRIDNDRDYEPGNVRWATRSEQNRNQRRSRLDAETVRQMRILRALGITFQWIGDAFGVSKVMARNVAVGNSWAA